MNMLCKFYRLFTRAEHLESERLKREYWLRFDQMLAAIEERAATMPPVEYLVMARDQSEHSDIWEMDALGRYVHNSVGSQIQRLREYGIDEAHRKSLNFDFLYSPEAIMAYNKWRLREYPNFGFE